MSNKVKVFDQEYWDKCLKGYLIYDAAISSPTRYWFVLIQDIKDHTQLQKVRFLSVDTKLDKDEGISLEEYDDFSRSRISFMDSGWIGAVAVDKSGFVYSYDIDGYGTENNHPDEMEGSEMGMLINQVVRINNCVYTACDFRRCFRRVGMDKWQEMTKTLELPASAFDEKLNPADVGWEDIDGFSESDIYAVGGKGDVWHFDGKEWQQCDFPSNELLYNVACGGDGNVYIGGNLGSLWVGRKDSWKLISKGNFSIDWKDLAWFADQLWLSFEYGLWELKDGKIQRAQVPDAVQTCTGVIDITPDGALMLIAGHNGAALFDGKKWEVLFNRYDFEGTFSS